MNDRDLQDLCKVWQERLRLQNWRIDVRFAGSSEMHGDAQGSCTVFSENHMAVIRLLKPEGYDATNSFIEAFPDDTDPERILIHELLHIPFDRIIDVDAEGFMLIAQEQAINQVTDALFAAYTEEAE